MGCALSAAAPGRRSGRGCRCGTRRPTTTGRPAPRCPGTPGPTSPWSGAGLTGLWTAYYLLREDPTLRVVVLEAETAGFGASGRNGGWCSALFPAGPATLAALPGVDRDGRPRAAPGDARHRRRGARRWRPPRASTPGPTRAARSGSPASASQLAARPRRRSAAARRWGRGEDDLRLLDADEARSRLAATDVLGAHLHPGLRRGAPGPAGPRAGAGGRAPGRPRSTSGPGCGSCSSPARGHRARHRRGRRGGAGHRGLHPLLDRHAPRRGAGLLPHRRDRAAARRTSGSRSGCATGRPSPTTAT